MGNCSRYNKKHKGGSDISWIKVLLIIVCCLVVGVLVYRFLFTILIDIGMMNKPWIKPRNQIDPSVL